MTKDIIVDAHEDLAWNMLTFGRDYSRPAAETRRLEQDTDFPAYNGDTLLGWADYQAGSVAIVFGTLFAAPRRRTAGWAPLGYEEPEDAHRLYWSQVEQYHRFIDQYPDQFRLIESLIDLHEVLSYWSYPRPEPQPSSSQVDSERPVGLVI